MILAVDTSYKRFSVALRVEERVFEVVGDGDFKHVEGLNPAVKRLLEGVSVAPRDISAVLLTLGPGFFTSLRVGASFAKAMHLFNGCSLYGFSTFQLALTGLPDGRYVALMDARKGQVYAQAFLVKGSLPHPDPSLPLGIYPPEDVGLEGYERVEVSPQRLRASKLFPLFDGGLYRELGPDFSPLYIRPPDAVVNLKKGLQP